MSKKATKDNGNVNRYGPYNSVQDFNKSITYGREENIVYRRIPSDAKKFSNLKLNSTDNNAKYVEAKNFEGTTRTENH